MSIDRREALRRTALLLGGAVSASTVAGVLAGCGEASAATSQWKPRATTSAESELIAAVADQIIPRTDTPGARDAGVHRFIDTMLAEYYTPAERETLLKGVADVDARAQAAHAKPFLRCTQAQQRATLDTVDREAFPTTPVQAGSQNATDASRETERGGGGTAASSSAPPGSTRHYFRTIKELVIVGYYTSQPGATKELRYVQVPGRFDGCVPMSKIGRTWAV